MIRRLLGILLCLAGAGCSGPHFDQQLVTGNGGNGVTMDGEWMAVGEPEDCLIFVYKFDFATKLWGDGGQGSAAPVAGRARQTIEPPEGLCFSSKNRGYGEVVSLNKRLLIVGAPEAKGPRGIERDGEELAGNTGTVYLYLLDEATGLFEVVVTSLEAEDPNGDLRIADGARFGAAVSVSNDLIAIGAPSEAVLGSPNGGRGEVYFYRFDFATETLINLGFIEGDDPDDQFGFSVTLDAPRALVGVPGSDLSGVNNAGASYLYQVDSGNLQDPITLIEKITVDPEFTPIRDNHSGQEVSLSDELVLLAGQVAYPLEPVGNSFISKFEYERSAGGDVSQSEGVAAFGITEIGLDIYPDVLNDNADQRSNYHLEVDLTAGPGALVANGMAAIGTLGTPIRNLARDIRIYKDIVMVSDRDNNQVRSLVFPCGYGAELKPLIWSLVSIPCELPPGTTVEKAFNADIFPGACDPECGALGAYGINWRVWGQDGNYTTGSASRSLEADDVIETGKAYWIIADASLKPPGQPVYWNVDTTTAQAYTPISDVDSNPLFNPPTDVAGYHEQVFPISELADVDDARIMIGNPFPRSINWEKVVVRVRGTAVPVALAQSAFPLVGMGDAYLYNPTITEGEPYDVVSATPGFSNVIPPNTGFWVALPPATLRPESIILPLEK